MPHSNELPEYWKTHGIDSPTVDSSVFRQFIAMGHEADSAYDEIAIGDISTAFLLGNIYGDSQEPRYVKIKQHRTGQWKVYQLLGGLYGATDAAVNFYDTASSYLKEQGYTRSENEICAFYNKTTKHKALIHVDDVIVKGSPKTNKQFFEKLNERFPLKGWDTVRVDNPLRYCGKTVGMYKDKSNRHWYYITQKDEIEQLLMEENMLGVRTVKAPMPDKNELYQDCRGVTETEHKWIRSVVGALSYFAVETRDDITLEVNRIAQTLSKPTQGTIQAIKRVLAYLSGTSDRCLKVPFTRKNIYTRYVDSDHAGDRSSGTQSRTGIAFYLNGMPFKWRSKKQPVAALSSAEAEIYAASEAAKAAKVSQWIAEEMGEDIEWPAKLFVDNSAAINFQRSTNSATALKGMINLRDNHIREMKNKKFISTVKVDGLVNLADSKTKCLPAKDRKRLELVHAGLYKHVLACM